MFDQYANIEGKLSIKRPKKDDHLELQTTLAKY